MADHLFAGGPALSCASADTAERPADYASRLYGRYVAEAIESERRDFGQFFTPVAVARMMARLAMPPDAESLRILEPGAGTAILASALCETLPDSVRTIHIDAFEIHPVLADLCTDALENSRCWLDDRGVRCTFNVHRTDFVIANASRVNAQLFDVPHDAYDVAISNPPYFKLQKQDPRALAVSDMVHGQ